MTERDALTKPSIDWTHVHPDYIWLAQDADGQAWLYSVEPSTVDGYWWASGGEMTSGKIYASCTPGNCEWKDSLVRRPTAREGLCNAT